MYRVLLHKIGNPLIEKGHRNGNPSVRPWRGVEPEEVLDGEDHDAGGVQAEEHRLVTLPARQSLLRPTGNLQEKEVI